MTQIIPITSESLQAQVRRLLPSQQGFGVDLSASSTIQAIIDLTPTAEGSQLPEYLRRAANFQNMVDVEQTGTGTATLATSPGFYEFHVTLSILTSTVAGTNTSRIAITDTLAQKDIFKVNNNSDSAGEEPVALIEKGVAFLRPNDSLIIQCIGADTFAQASAWPIADLYGNLTNPGGFSFE